MEKVKKFFRYFLMFIGLYIVVNLLTYCFMIDSYKEITNYEILTEEPAIQITECKASYSKGHINGKITNNTSELIRDIYIKADFYNKHDEYVGSRYATVNLLNVKEVNNFSIVFDCEAVEKFKISVVQEKPDSAIHTTDKFNETVEKYFPFIGIITLIYLLP